MPKKKNVYIMTADDEKMQDFFSFRRGFKTYVTIDNGGRAFLVTFNARRIYIGRFQTLSSEKGVVIFVFKHILTYPNRGIFVGKDSERRWAEGNSIVFRLTGSTYMYVGDRIFSFKAPDKPVKLISQIGGTSAYPCLVGKKGYYLLSERVYTVGKPPPIAYETYYRSPEGHKWNRFAVKIVVPRAGDEA